MMELPKEIVLNCTCESLEQNLVHGNGKRLFYRANLCGNRGLLGFRCSNCNCFRLPSDGQVATVKPEKKIQ